MKIGDVAETLAGLPVGTWARAESGRVWCVLTREIHAACGGPSGADYIPGSSGVGFGPFTICRPPVGAVLPSARYAPEGTWMRDCEGDVWHVSASSDGVPAFIDGNRVWFMAPGGHQQDDTAFAPFTVIADPREADDSFTIIDDARDGAGAATAGKSFIADLRRRLRTPESINPRRMTWGDAEGATSRRVAPKPEPMPRVDLITTGGDQSWRKARPVSRRLGRVEPVCGWSSYYGGE